MIDILDDDTTSGAERIRLDQPGPQNLIVGDWSAASRQGDHRARNEDNWGQLGSVFCVADGMGGLQAGDVASRTATRHLISQWFSGDGVNPIEMMQRINEHVRHRLAGVDAGGTTLSAVRIAHDQATIVHIGDSRVYRVRAGQTELVSREHNLRTELLAAGIPPSSTTEFGPLRALTSYLGMPTSELQVDVRSIALRAGDIVVLCTDGVFAGRTHNRIADELRTVHRKDAPTIAAALTSGVRADDATAIVIKIGTAGSGQRT